MELGALAAGLGAGGPGGPFRHRAVDGAAAISAHLCFDKRGVHLAGVGGTPGADVNTNITGGGALGPISEVRHGVLIAVLTAGQNRTSLAAEEDITADTSDASL